MDISIDIHANMRIVDMDIDVKFHIYVNSEENGCVKTGKRKTSTGRRRYVMLDDK